MNRLLVFLALIALPLCAVPATGQSRQACPPIIASLLPKIGVDPTGSFNIAGEMGMGSGVAQIPFSHPCITSTKYPARLSLAITYYDGEMAALLEMQGDAADQQAIANATEELTRVYGSRGSKTLGKSPVKTERLSGATIVYVDYMSECPAEGAAGAVAANRPPVPNLRLNGVARTANVRMEISLEGQISTELAISIVKEVVENLKKANFTAQASAGT